MRTKILVIGNSFFGSQLVRRMKKYRFNNKFKIYSAYPYESLWGKVKYLSLIPFCATVYSIGGGIDKSISFKVAKLFKKRLVIHWIGSDVVKALECCRAGNIDPELIDYPEHLCEVAWIQEELREIGINADICNIASVEAIDESRIPMPDEFQVLTYIGKGRESFYGMDIIVELARRVPDLTINIAGVESFSESLPRNIRLLGWLNSTKDIFSDSIVYIRLTKHDGLPFSVIEALSYGRYVIWSQPYGRFVYYVTNCDELVRIILDLRSKFQAGRLGLNLDGIEFVKKEFSERETMENLIKVLVG